MTDRRQHLDFDRAGIPVYTDDVSLLAGYKQRCMDVFYGRQGQERQCTTAIDLRSGTRGAAWDAVKDIAHNELMTVRYEGTGKNERTIATIEVVDLPCFASPRQSRKKSPFVRQSSSIESSMCLRSGGSLGKQFILTFNTERRSSAS